MCLFMQLCNKGRRVKVSLLKSVARKIARKSDTVAQNEASCIQSDCNTCNIVLAGNCSQIS